MAIECSESKGIIRIGKELESSECALMFEDLVEDERIRNIDLFDEPKKAI